ncbi:siderophore biosynthesis enzyme [Apiospora hydei]|uniref:Siderophore biosynthesis enzyme n=1 Tax=Apiospora hydei TaxID=1337664 RepID=A0ABR1WRH7_9PEZI
MHSVQALLAAALLAAPIAAKTDIGGCVSSATKNQWGEASMIWYVPGTGEVCELLDCGGGRAPPKTNVPGCGNYKGTAKYSPTFLPGFGPDAVAASSTASPAAASTTTAAEAGSTSKAAGTTILSGVRTETDEVPGTTMLTGTRSGTITAAPTATSTGSAETGKTTEAPSDSPKGSESKGSDSSSSSSTPTTAPTGAGVAASAAPFGMIVCLAAAIALSDNTKSP